MWAASLGKILTIDNLIKQGMVMVSCCMCKSSEGPGRLPVHCSFSYGVIYLKELVFMMFEVCWVMPKSVHMMLQTESVVYSSIMLFWDSVEGEKSKNIHNTSCQL